MRKFGPCWHTSLTARFLIIQLIEILKKPTPEHSNVQSDIPDVCGSLSTGSVIVYVWRQHDAEVIAENIQASGISGGVVVYHGGMDAASRAKAQSRVSICDYYG
jgi:ATP-dependent DNA helicase Q4